MDEAAGRRLERYLRARWGRQQRGMRGLAAKAGTTAETLYSWFRGDTEPSLASLTELAAAVGVNRSEILAVMDGLAPTVPLDQDLRREIATEVARQLDEYRRRRPDGLGDAG